jgi:putative two-component system response regulator
MSLPVGFTKIVDTGSFLGIMHSICKSGRITAEKFVLVEDYTLHTGSDYDGRVTYIRRMINEIHPAGIIFITRSTSWKLSIKIGVALYGAPFPVKLVPSYRDALHLAADMLGRPLESALPPGGCDRIDTPDFSMSVDVVSPSLFHVKFRGCPSAGDLTSITDLYLSLPHRPGVDRMFRTIHDFSAMKLPAPILAFRIFRMILSRQYNNGECVAIVNGGARGVVPMVRAVAGVINVRQRLDFYGTGAEAIEAARPDGVFVPVFRENMQMAALEMLETIAWDKPGYADLESVKDPFLKPLALMLGSIKQDLDYYLAQRQRELEKLEESNERSRQLSHDIEQAFKRSEEDRIKAETLSTENLALSGEITRSQKEVFLVLADYIDRRAGFPVGSTRLLARFAVKIAVFFGYGEEERTRLHDAILLIHTGYLAIPENEPNAELHCIFGGEVLGNINTFIMQFASHIARYHHEKWNGLGYPEHLIGDLIPHEARLIALADFLLSTPDSQLEAALHNESGRAFEPAMVSTILLHMADVRRFIAECKEVPTL